MPIGQRLQYYRYPEDVVITDISAPTASGTDTPQGESDDFFSSWDKPAIKRPSNPPSKASTPQISRAASPFLNPNANGNGPNRPKSPLANKEGDSAPVSRAIPSAQVRKPTTTGGSRKANVLGGKKAQKLGAKKVTAGTDLDFEAAEKKAKEEAERIEKLGYDPDAEDAEAAEAKKEATVPMKKTTTTDIVSPTPLSPGKNNVSGHQRNSSEVERLGMGVARLGFGQVGAKPGVGGAAPKKMGFGAVGGGKAATEGTLIYTLFPSHHFFSLD